MCFVALFHLFEHPPNLVRGNIITWRLVADLLLHYHVFMLIYYLKFLLWIVDYQNVYSSGNCLFYSRYLLPLLWIIVLHLPVDAYDHITSLHQTKLRKWCNISIYMYSTCFLNLLGCLVLYFQAFFFLYVIHLSYFSYFGNKLTWQLDVMSRVRVLSLFLFCNPLPHP